MNINKNEIPVVILCGGKGTRMREETEFKPKPLVDIGERPMLWHIMKIYAHYGFKNFVLALGYKGLMIKQFFYTYDILSNDFTMDFSKESHIIKFHNNEIDWKITFVDTGMDTLKGGRIKRIQKYINTPYFMLTYGDGLADINIDSLVNFHLSHGKIGTLTGVLPPSRFGDIEIKGNQVIKFSEKSQSSGGLINGGFFVFKSKMFDYLTSDENCDFEFGPLEQIVRDEELMVYEHHGSWECMDNLRDIEHLNKLWKTNKAFWKIWE